MSEFEAAYAGELPLLDFDLPPLPSVIRYYDDFEDKFNSIREPENLDRWDIYYDGGKSVLDFGQVSSLLRVIVKHVAADIFLRMDPSAAEKTCRGLLNSFSNNSYLIRALVLRPDEFRVLWVNDILPSRTWSYCSDIRAVLHSLCNLSIGHWRPEMRPYVSLLESPQRDIYKTVRTGECFVPLDQQSLIIEYLDTLADRVAVVANVITTTELRGACILILTHQYGVRPGQSARVRCNDVHLHETGAVHLALPLLKQRGNEKMAKVTRRMKLEWCPIFIEYTARSSAIPSTGVPADSYFKLSPKQLSIVLMDLLEELTQVRWTPTDLRHTAAQRLADAGTSHIILSEFMGHSTTLSANVYFDSSPTQAHRINQALGISKIYSSVVDVAKTRTIDKQALLQLPADKQIGGVPHGIPIAGIGGCSTGQSLCLKNPILSCYTCRKFMPLADPIIHESVVASLRPVVNEFVSASRFNDESPAYTQLSRMFQAALGVSDAIRARNTDEGGDPQ